LVISHCSRYWSSCSSPHLHSVISPTFQHAKYFFFFLILLLDGLSYSKVHIYQVPSRRKIFYCSNSYWFICFAPVFPSLRLSFHLCMRSFHLCMRSLIFDFKIPVVMCKKLFVPMTVKSAPQFVVSWVGYSLYLILILYYTVFPIGEWSI
jgi:hypothetical protein